MTDQHPPPWHWTEYDAIEDRDGGEVLSVSSGNQWVASDRARGLIVAAPEMEALLRSEDAGQSCDYGDTPAFCPMTPICWRHRRDALLARVNKASRG